MHHVTSNEWDLSGKGDSRRVHRLRNRRKAVAQVPANHNLGRRLAVLLGQVDDQRVLKRSRRRILIALVGAADPRPGKGGAAARRIRGSGLGLAVDAPSRV